MRIVAKLLKMISFIGSVSDSSRDGHKQVDRATALRVAVVWRRS